MAFENKMKLNNIWRFTLFLLIIIPMVNAQEIKEQSFLDDDLGIITISYQQTPSDLFAIFFTPTNPKPNELVKIEFSGQSLPYSPTGIGDQSNLLVSGPGYTKTYNIKNFVSSALPNGAGDLAPYYVSFTPSNEGIFRVEIRITNGDNSALLLKEIGSITVAIQAKDCPSIQDSGWNFFDDTSDGNGKIENRKITSYEGIAPNCIPNVIESLRTICDDGFIISGTNLKQTNGAKSCEKEGIPLPKICEPFKIISQSCIDSDLLKSTTCNSDGTRNDIEQQISCKNIGMECKVNDCVIIVDSPKTGIQIARTLDEYEGLTSQAIRKSLCRETSHCQQKEGFTVECLDNEDTEPIVEKGKQGKSFLDAIASFAGKAAFGEKEGLCIATSIEEDSEDAESFLCKLELYKATDDCETNGMITIGGILLIMIIFSRLGK